MKLRTEGITWQESDGEHVVLGLESSSYLPANPTGTLLGELLREERTLDELRDAEYGIGADVGEADARAHDDELRRFGLPA